MAQKAKKDRAKGNTAALLTLHTTSLTLTLLFVTSHFLLSRPPTLPLSGLFITPAVICEYVLEASGRPKYDPTTKALKNSGEDLSAAGLTEYMFDVIWVTWAAMVLVMLTGSNWAWVVWGLVPAYALYLGKGLLGMGKGLMGGMGGAGQQQQQQEVPQGNRRSRRQAA